MKMFLTCPSTVFALRVRRSQMPLLEQPSAIRASTSRSRPASRPRGLAGRARRRSRETMARVDHAFAPVPPGERAGEHTHAGHAFLEQIADPALMLLDQPHRVARLEVAGQDEQLSEHNAGI